MSEDLDTFFAEAVEADSGEEVIDNPDLGTDTFDDQTDADDEIVEDDTTDTDEDVPPVESDGFDWNEVLERHGDHLVQLTVNGQIVEKPLRDLPKMAMMQEDYSRKTAEVASLSKAAQWAQDVQAAFADDPLGTLEAFAKAYQVDFAAPQAAQSQTDPYEDFEPEIADALRQRDALLARQQQQLEALSNQYQGIEHNRLMAEVKAEVSQLQAEFGDELDHVEMLNYAATYNMPLREAAEVLMGRQYYAKSRKQQTIDSDAERLATAKSGEERQAAKKRASGTATKKFDASNVSAEDFNDIGELFEITLNSMT
jgi:hypothetical protein